MTSPRFPPVLLRRAALLLGAAFVFPAGLLHAQDDSGASGDASPSTTTTGAAPSSIYPEAVEPGAQGLNRVNSFPLSSFGENPAGVPYSGVLTPTGANFNGSNVSDGPPVNSNGSNYNNLNATVGQGEGSGLVRSGSKIPFLVHAPEPEDANIKAGPFFIKFHSMDGLVLYDDNYATSQNDRKAETLILLRLNMTVIAQLTDNLQFALAGSLDYLPLQNDFGIESSDLLLLGPFLAAQFVYDTVVAGWPVRFADDFTAGAGIYSSDVSDNFDLFQGDELARDENGRYSFHDYQTGQSSDVRTTPLIYFSNTISAVTDRLLPDDIRLTVRVEHQDLWYNQENRGLPDSRDDFLTSLVSERPNLRFEPYLSYEATAVGSLSQITQSVWTGIFGPIDDQVFLHAAVGYSVGPNNRDNFLYRLSLDHTAGPYTSEHLVIARELSYFDQEAITFEYYRLDQTLGPTLYGSLFLTRSTYEDLVNDGGSNVTDNIAGLQLTWYVGPRTTLALAGIYDRQQYSDGPRRDIVTGRVVLNHTITDSLTVQLLYQNTHAVDNRPGDSYYENLVYLRIIKYLE